MRIPGVPGMLCAAMTKHLPSLPLATLLLLLGACAENTEDAGSPDVPPAADSADGEPKVFQKELLEAPEEKVRSDTLEKSAADFPDLRVDTLAEGKGDATLGAWDSGRFHIVLSLASGKVVENTRETAARELRMVGGAVVPGMLYGLIGMKAGERRRLLIPAALAHGDQGDRMRGIPPHATLIVDAELLELGDDPDPDFLIRRIQAGSGEPIRAGQSGQFHYTGILAEGEDAGMVFDSSHTRGSPATFEVGPGASLIEGWKIGLLGMKKGEKRWLRIPPQLAYGSQSQNKIPADSTLIFAVELVSF